MPTQTTQFESPGQYIDWLISERGWTQRILATVLGVEESSVSKLLSNKRSVTAELAITLEAVFDIPAERFLRMQSDYELAIARRAAKPIKGSETRAFLFGSLPIAEMIRRGWLDAENSRDIPAVESALLKFFNAPSLEEIKLPAHAAKKTDATEEPTPAQMAWLHRVRQIASEMLVGQFSLFNARRAAELLRELTLSAESARKVPRILADAGIRFVIVESLPHAKIDGVCCWLDDATPVIAMTLRHDRIDNFWFVLRHELEHVIQGHGKTKTVIDAELEGERAGTGADIAAEERIANGAAAEFCVPQKTMDAFVARKAPFFAERDILGVAASLRVHPGLVAGQLQHRTGRYDRFRNHLVKMRSIVAPNAIVDGWGDVIPVGI